MPRKSKDEEKVSKKIATNKGSIKKSTAKAVSKKKASKKTSTTTKKTVAKKVSKSTAKKSTAKKSPVIDVVEYYDLPYRYNETVVKVLAQNPETLFIYWDISDKDKQNFIEQYGEFFFNDTKPVLVVHNDTLHYSFEIDINDYLQISTSNEMDAPNDHILFDSLNNNVFFKNYKTNVISQKDISLYFLSRIGKLYNVKDFYKTMYKDEDIDFEKLNFRNMPSS